MRCEELQALTVESFSILLLEISRSFARAFTYCNAFQRDELQAPYIKRYPTLDFCVFHHPAGRNYQCSARNRTQLEAVANVHDYA